MNIFNNKKKFCVVIFLCSILFFFTSCNDDETEELFNQAPSVRVDERISELQELLLSQPNGYKAVYFPKDDERGGFTTYLKFNSDGSVRQISDFTDADQELRESLYEVRFDTTTELVFTTNNHIAYGVNAATDDSDTWFGTMVFQYFSNDNGVLTFRDVRHRDNAIMKLYPTGFSDFDTESVAGVNQLRSQIPKLAEPPIYLVLEFDNTTSGITKYDFLYNPLIRFSRSTGFSETEIIDVSFGIAYTENGITISPPLEFEGQTYIDFIYNETTERFVSEVNGTTASIYYSFDPAFINPNDVLDIENGDAFQYIDVFGNNPYLLTNSVFLDLHDTVKTDTNALLNPEFQYVGFQVRFNFDDDNCETDVLTIVEEVATGDFFILGTYCFESVDIMDDKLFLTYIGPDPGSANAATFESPLMPLIDFLTNSNGLIFSRTGSFSTNLVDFPNTSATLAGVTAEGEPARVYGFYFN